MARNPSPPPQTPSALIAALRSLCRVERGWTYAPKGRMATFTRREQDGRLVTVQIWIGAELASSSVSVVPPVGGRVKIIPPSVELTIALVSLALGWGEQS